MPDLIKSIKVNTQRSREFIDHSMLMTDRAYELVQSGLPFSEAYIKVKSNQEKDLVSRNLSKKNSSTGSAYNLDLKILRARLKKLSKSK